MLFYKHLAKNSTKPIWGWGCSGELFSLTFTATHLFIHYFHIIIKLSPTHIHTHTRHSDSYVNTSLMAPTIHPFTQFIHLFNETYIHLIPLNHDHPLPKLYYAVAEYSYCLALTIYLGWYIYYTKHIYKEYYKRTIIVSLTQTYINIVFIWYICIHIPKKELLGY